MKLQIPTQISNIDAWNKAGRFVDLMFSAVVSVVNGRLTFADNFLAQTTSVTFTATATDTAVPHTLGFLPNGYIVTGRSDNMTIYNGATANTTSILYLRTDATGTASILIF